MDSNTRNTRRRQRDKIKPGQDEIMAPDDELPTDSLWQGEFEGSFLTRTPEVEDEFGISFLILHFLIMYPITGYKIGQTVLVLGLLSTQQFLIRNISYLAPIILGYVNIHLGAVFLIINFMKGPLEEREGIAAIYGRITYLLLRTKELEWIKDNISNQYYTREPEVGHNQTNMSSLVQWFIVIIFLSVPRGAVMSMFGIFLGLYLTPEVCEGNLCPTEEQLDSVYQVFVRVYTAVAQYFTFSTQLECITALIAYCTGMTLLLYLSRYTRVAGQSLQELMLLLFGGFGLLAVRPFVGMVMGLFSLCLTNTEFYKAIILAEDRDQLSPPEKKATLPSDSKEDPKIDKKQEIKNKILRAKNLNSKKSIDNLDVEDIMVEFLPYKVPEAEPNESFYPNGQGGMSWNSVMAIVLAVYYPFYDYSLSTKMKFATHSYEYATVLVTVAHPLVQ
jgi:hypothetical protein